MLTLTLSLYPERRLLSWSGSERGPSVLCWSVAALCGVDCDDDDDEQHSLAKSSSSSASTSNGSSQQNKESNSVYNSLNTNDKNNKRSKRSLYSHSLWSSLVSSSSSSSSPTSPSSSSSSSSSPASLHNRYKPLLWSYEVTDVDVAMVLNVHDKVPYAEIFIIILLPCLCVSFSLFFVVVVRSHRRAQCT